MRITREKNAPDFLVVGAAKSGTTSLWHYLHQHPDIFVNQGLKELGYFSDGYGVSDLDEYLKYYDEATEGQIIGEICHAYLSSRESPRRIWEFNPSMKIIMILRDPVRRAYSLYNWMVQNGYESSQTFEIAIESERERSSNADFRRNNSFYLMNYFYLDSGMYYEQVKGYFDFFPKENIKVIVYEHFRNDNYAVLNEIFRFLNVEAVERIVPEVINESNFVRNPKLQFFLMNRFSRLCNDLLIPQKLAFILKSALLRINSTRSKPKPLDSELYNHLAERYKKDIDNLSKLTSIDFTTCWRFKYFL